MVVTPIVVRAGKRLATIVRVAGSLWVAIVIGDHQADALGQSAADADILVEDVAAAEAVTDGRRLFEVLHHQFALGDRPRRQRGAARIMPFSPWRPSANRPLEDVGPPGAYPASCMWATQSEGSTNGSSSVASSGAPISSRAPRRRPR